MTSPIALPVTKRARGNPNWGKALGPVPALLTEFEMQVERIASAQQLTVRRLITTKALVPAEPQSGIYSGMAPCRVENAGRFNLQWRREPRHTNRSHVRTKVLPK